MSNIASQYYYSRNPLLRIWGEQPISVVDLFDVQICLASVNPHSRHRNWPIWGLKLSLRVHTCVNGADTCLGTMLDTAEMP